MPRYTIRIDQENLEKIETRAKENKVTIANYIRYLVDAGLRVEEVTQLKNKENHHEEMLKTLQLKSFQSIIEILLIVRRIIDYTNNSQVKTEDVLKHVVEKARAYIDGFLDETI